MRISKNRFRFRICILLVLAGAALAVGQEEGFRPGPFYKGKCSVCHVVPDPALRTDRAWIDQVLRTTWTGISERAREALKKHLLGEGVERPAVLPPASGETKGMAIVTLGRIRCRVTLSGPSGDVTVVSTGTRELSRWALPPGSYRLREVRVEAEKDGEWWFLSSSTGPLREPMELKAGTETALDPGKKVHFTAGVKRQPGGLYLSFNFQTGNRCGLSVFRDGRRIGMWHQLLDAGGGVLSEGPLGFG